MWGDFMLLAAIDKSISCNSMAYYSRLCYLGWVVAFLGQNKPGKNEKLFITF